MLKKIIWVSFLFFLITGCKESETDVFIENGIYSGTFTLINENGKIESGKVTFTFFDNKYSCVPEKIYYPPVGGGKFSINGNKIKLTDTSVHTAEFDWTLILDGEFFISYEGKTILMKQQDIKYKRVRTILLSKQN